MMIITVIPNSVIIPSRYAVDQSRGVKRTDEVSKAEFGVTLYYLSPSFIINNLRMI